MSPNSNPYISDTLEDRATIFKPGEGDVLKIKGGNITFKVTSLLSNDQLGVYEIMLEPGTLGARLHFHRYMDETFLVHAGTLRVQHGRQEVDAPAGSVIYVPRFTPHGFANTSEKRVVLTLIFNPAAKREGFFYGLEQVLGKEPMDMKEFLALYNKYDSFPVEPDELAK